MIRIISLIIFAGLVSSEGINPQCFYESGFAVISGVHLTSNEHIRFDCNQLSHQLKFRNSSLVYIPSTIFSQYLSLRSLDISNSGIIDLSQDNFTSAERLQRLNLSGNSIEKITAFAFSGAKLLDNIDLSYNRISELNEHSFGGLRYLRLLDMTGNQLIILRASFFVDNISLLVLKFRENQITTIEPNIFRNAQLYSIDLSNNQIQNFTLNCANWEILNIAHNNLTDFEHAIGLENLKELDLSYNHIPKISTSTLASLKNLQKLNLTHTNFTGLTYGTFSKLTKLESLDLSDNNLQTLNLDMLYHYHTLQELYLSGNNFTEFSGKFKFSLFPALLKLDIRWNNFNCSYLSQLVAQKHYLFADLDHESNNDNRSNIYGIECHHDAEPFSDTTEKLEDSEMIKLQEKHIKKIVVEHLAQYHNNSQSMNNNDEKHHTEQTEQHKLLLKLFIMLLSFLTFIVIIGFGIIVYRSILSKRLPSVNASVSYRSTNTIQSNVDLIQ